jgi:hypothetical protein
VSNWNATIKCVKEYNPGKGATLDQAYNVTDGKLNYDNGQASFRNYENIEEINNSNTAKFTENKKRGRPKKEKED